MSLIVKKEQEKYPLTAERREKLEKVATTLMDIWDGLIAGDMEDGEPYPYVYMGGLYRAGALKLAATGGYSDNWVALDWNQVVADIFVGQQLQNVSYDEIVKTVEAEENAEIDKNAAREVSM